MGIRFDKLKDGGFVIRESVSETLIGECDSFAWYVEIMRGAMLDFADGVTKEELLATFKSNDDKRLIDIFFDYCDECGERLIDCVCKTNDGNIEWIKKEFPYLMER